MGARSAAGTDTGTDNETDHEKNNETKTGMNKARQDAAD